MPKTASPIIVPCSYESENKNSKTLYADDDCTVHKLC